MSQIFYLGPSFYFLSKNGKLFASEWPSTTSVPNLVKFAPLMTEIFKFKKYC